MFKVGDIVELVYPPYPVYEGSAIDNLVGTIAKIKEVSLRQKFQTTFEATYHIEFIEIHMKDKNCFEESQANYSWKDQHFKLIGDYDPNLNIQDFDIEEIFN